MSITGNVKIFKKNYMVLYDQGSVASSNNTIVGYIYDQNRETKWESSGSADTTTETIEISWSETITINRLACININWKQFIIQYDAGAGYTNFTNVISVKTDTPTTGISYTDNALNTRYFEFDSVDVVSIKISPVKTIIANAEKYLYELYVGEEIGTFVDDITSTPNNYEATARYNRSKYLEKSNGGIIKYERADKYRAKVKIKQLWELLDRIIIDTMYIDGDICISPCGFDNNYTDRGWRLQDFYSVIIKGNQEAEFSIGRDKNVGFDYQFELQET